MIIAIGEKTRTIYATGKYRNEVLRKLQQEYPYRKRENYDSYVNKVLPETLILKKVKDDEMSILQPQTKRDTRISRTLETV